MKKERSSSYSTLPKGNKNNQKEWGADKCKGKLVGLLV